MKYFVNKVYAFETLKLFFAEFFFHFWNYFVEKKYFKFEGVFSTLEKNSFLVIFLQKVTAED